MAAKRARKHNFTSNERITLIEEFAVRKDILQQKFKSTLTNKQKQVAWAEVTAAINAVSPVERSVAEVKEKWSKLSSEARAQLRARKFPPTGSGKAIEMPDLELFEPIFENSDLIEGISMDVGGFHSGEASQAHRRRSQTPDRLKEAQRQPFEITTVGHGFLCVASSTPSSSRLSDITPSRPASATSSTAEIAMLTELSEIPSRINVPQSTAERSASAGIPELPPTKRPTRRREPPAQNNQGELYCQYLTVSTELKKYLINQMQSDVSDTELKELDKEKKRLEIQCIRDTLELKEIKKEKLLTEMRQAADINELEKEKLNLEIQLLKNKVTDANK